jgi:hypothetical protein
VEKWLFMAIKLTATARRNTKRYIKVLFTLIFNSREILHGEVYHNLLLDVYAVRVA